MTDEKDREVRPRSSNDVSPLQAVLGKLRNWRQKRVPAPHVSRNPTVNASLGGVQAGVTLCAPHLAHAMSLE